MGTACATYWKERNIKFGRKPKEKRPLVISSVENNIKIDHKGIVW
jgi:hypothetical protein